MIIKELIDMMMGKRFIPGEQKPAIYNIPNGNKTPNTNTKLSPWKYGSGAYRGRLNLPPITRCVTSAPTGSGDTSHWPASRTMPNRRSKPQQ